MGEKYVQYGGHIENQDGGTPVGVSEFGSNQKIIPQGSPTSVPSFIISPQSEIFCHIFVLAATEKPKWRLLKSSCL